MAANDPATVSWASSVIDRLITAKATGPSSWCCTAVPRKPTDRPPELDRRTRFRQHIGLARQVHEHEPTRGPAEILHARHRLLAPVAALVEMYRRADPADLVRDRPVIGLEPQPRPASLDPLRLVGPQSGGRRTGGDQAGDFVGQPCPRDHEVDVAPRCPAGEAATWQRGRAGHRRAVSGGKQDGIGGRPDQPDHGPVVGDVAGLDPLEEAHLLQVGQSVIGHARLGVQPHRAVAAR